MKKIIALLFTLFAAALITSCNLSLTENKTAIKLTLPKYINSSSARQAYTPSEIAYYDIFCRPILTEEIWMQLHEDFEKNYTPDYTQENEYEDLETLMYKTNEEFQHRYAELKNVKPGETVTITELLEGKYSISIQGYSLKEDYPIAWGYSDEIELIANETKNVTIKMYLSEKAEILENEIKFNLALNSNDLESRCNEHDFTEGVALIIEKDNFLKFQATELKDINPYDPVSVSEFMASCGASNYVAAHQQFYSIKNFTISTANLESGNYYLYILGLSDKGTICLQGNTLFSTEKTSQEYKQEYNLTYYFLTKHIPLTINFTGNIAEKLTSIVTNESTSPIDLNNIPISGCIKLWNETCDKLIETYALPMDLQEIITAVLMDDSTNNSINSLMTIYLDSSAFTSGQKYNVLLQVYATGNNLNLINKSYIESFVYNNSNNSVILTLK